MNLQTPYNGTNWLVAMLPTADPSVVDILFDYAEPITSYTLAVTYAGGESQTVIATSSVSAPTNYSLMAAQATIQAGQSVNVSWTSPSGNAKDWIAWFKIGDANTLYDRNRWRYTGGASSGSFALTAPTSAGTYELRYLVNDGFTSTTRSQTVTVLSNTVSNTATSSAVLATTVQNLSVNGTTTAGLNVTAATSGRTLYVATNGDDKNPGTFESILGHYKAIPAQTGDPASARR